MVKLYLIKNNNGINRQKIWKSWEKFASSVRDVAEVEWYQRKIEMTKYFSRCPETIHDYPVKVACLALIPATTFMIFFQFFHFWQYLLHAKTTPWIHLPSLEYFLFGCLPHQVISRITHPVLDILAAIPYLGHFLLPFGYPVYCYYHRAKLGNTIEPALRGLWMGGMVATCAVSFQFLFPTAPPWFNDSAVYDSKGSLINYGYNEAGFQRIDALINMPVFHEMYSNSPVTFGSFPSIHAAFPAIIFLNGSWVAHGGWKYGLCHILLISWAALYSHHHYLVDVIGGYLLSFFIYSFYHKVWNPFTKKTSTIVKKPRLLPEHEV